MTLRSVAAGRYEVIDARNAVEILRQVTEEHMPEESQQQAEKE